MGAGVPELDPATAERVRAACRAAGLAVERIEELPAGLSLRRFARVHTGDAVVPTLIARIEAPEDPAGRPAGAAPEPPHEPIRALLEREGLPVPRRLGGDAEGLDLLEDVGGRSLQQVAAQADPAARRALYAEACAWVPHLQRAAPAPGVAAFGRRLDAELLAYKADLLVRHGIAARGRPATAPESACVREAFARLARDLEGAPARLAHRDYQSANLFVATGAAPGRALRMIDLQGAFLAPPEYDLACLLCDSYVRLPDEEIRSQAEAVRPALPDAPDAETFARRFDWLALARKGKDYARFVHAARERGDTRFLAHIPTTLAHLHRAARAAAARDAWLAPLAELLLELPESPCAR